VSSTIVDAIWDAHVVDSTDDGTDLIFVDRNLLTDLSGTVGLGEVHAAQRGVRYPTHHLAMADHMIETGVRSSADASRHQQFVEPLRVRASAAGIHHVARGSQWQGIVHVTGLERGFTLPGLTVVCGDSHTSTHGAVGALAWGIGSTDVAHVLATQTLWMRRPTHAQITTRGALPFGTTAKDVALFAIAMLGADFGRERAVEWTGEAVGAMSVEERATLCNLGVELGARISIIAPDDVTFAYLAATDLAPRGGRFDQAVAAWRMLRSDDDAFAVRVAIDIAQLEPMVTWGTSPMEAVPVTGFVPAGASDASLAYMGLYRNQAMSDVAISHVFIGSCANGRLSDLRAAAEVLRGRHVSPRVRALVVPGSELVKFQAERDGLADIFINAGCEWRLPGCSMCVGINGDFVPAGEHCVSTSNRNFVGRQGHGARTHLASPATAAASAITGMISDPRPMMSQL
jgi:3-isopropylmalate/(R)-2-methylmalate dehydratase large subunit